MRCDVMTALLKEGGDVDVIGEPPVIRIALMRRVNSNPIRTANPANLGQLSTLSVEFQMLDCRIGSAGNFGYFDAIAFIGASAFNRNGP